MKIGDEVYIHGYVDEIRKDTVIIRNDGGYFGTVPNEIKITESYTLNKDEVDNLMSDLQKGDDLLTDDDLRLLINDAIKEKKAEQDKVTQWIKDNADFIKEMARLVAGEKKIIKCKDCAYLKGRDRYCSVLQTNFIPEDFACNQGELNGLVE